MAEQTLRDKIRDEVESVDAAPLLPHFRRDALFILAADVDLVDTAVAISQDDVGRIEALVVEGKLMRPNLTHFADWLVDEKLRFQFVVIQPYVLAQPIMRPQTA